jgi:hypothetical protein
MTIDLVQLLSYAGFAALGWWLRHQGWLAPAAAGPPAAATSTDLQALLNVLKSLIERGAQAPAAGGNAPASVFHVPIEVAASPKAPQSN